MKILYTSTFILLLYSFSFGQVGLQSTQKDLNNVYLRIGTNSQVAAKMDFGINSINTKGFLTVPPTPSVLSLQSHGSGNVTIGNTDASGTSDSDARLTVRAGDDALMDVRLEGQGRMSAQGGFNIYLDDNNNNAEEGFRVFPSASTTAVFGVFETGNAVLLGDLTITGNFAAANFPDYVFEPEYQLTSLPALKQQILELGHLPEIPSASEVKENGLALADMTKRMLKKIEELTLYVIDLKEQIDTLK